MAKEKILITVKTYPTLSRSYDEVVCTAGFREDGTWVRIYPVPFRKFDEYQRYKKFQWIELDLIRNSSDRRHESYRPQSEITLLEEMGRQNDWRERRQFVLERGEIYTNLDEIISKNRARELSLATFRPSEIIRVIAEPDIREWDKDTLDAVHQRNKQENFFEETRTDFQVVDKLPYKFKYEFTDDTGRSSKMMIEDWELGALYWRQFRKHGSEKSAIEDVKDKYMSDIVVGRDTHFFLGTTLKWDARGSNPFLIIGVFYPPQLIQTDLF